MRRLRYPQLSQGCVGAWSASQDTSRTTTITDFSGRNNVGSMNNMDPATDYLPKNNGQVGWDFDGSNDWIDIPIAECHKSIIVTLSAWVQTATGTGLYGGIIGAINDYYVGRKGYAMVSRSGTIWHMCADDSSYQEASGGAGSAHVVGELFHACVVFGPKFIYTYKNGNLTGSTNRTKTTTWTGVTKVRIGRTDEVHDDTGTKLKGRISDCRIYNRDLSVDEVRLLALRQDIAYETVRVRPPHRVAGPTFKAAWLTSRQSQIIGGGMR